MEIFIWNMVINTSRLHVNIVFIIGMVYNFILCFDISNAFLENDFSQTSFKLQIKCYYDTLGIKITETRSVIGCCRLCNLEAKCKVCRFCETTTGSRYCQNLNVYDRTSDADCSLSAAIWTCRYYEKVNICYYFLPSRGQFCRIKRMEIIYQISPFVINI